VCAFEKPDDFRQMAVLNLSEVAEIALKR